MEKTTEEMSRENSDILKWREENPMDYIKAMELIVSASNKEDVFKWIYEITRLYIPDVLFKYGSLTGDPDKDKIRFDTLRQEKVYLSAIDGFNDPFDSKAYFYRAEELMKYERLQHCGGRIIDDFSRFFRVACFTANGINSMPMWAHYASDHKGYCVSYDMKHEENLRLRACTMPVQYTTQRVDVTNLMDYQMGKIIEGIETGIKQQTKEIWYDDLSLIFLSVFFVNLKHRSWSYEKEFRCSMGANAPWSEYCKAKPQAIYIGAKCTEENKDQLIDIGKKLFVPVYQMRYDDYSADYSLLAEKVEM